MAHVKKAAKKETQPKKASSPKRQRRSRVETEQRLIDVALELIRNNGVLAGLNLRQVAEGAGVNRGNIYHYFGSRQGLLRAAINRQFNAFVNSYTKGKAQAGFVARRLRAFRSNVSNDTNDSMLRALLVLDGDNTVDPIPLYKGQLSQLRQEVIDGDIPLAELMAGLEIEDPNIFMEMCREYGIPDDQLVAKQIEVHPLVAAPPLGTPQH